MDSRQREQAQMAAETVFLTDQAVPLRSREAQLIGWLGSISIAALRICLGIVFLLFGALKLFDGVSPAEEIAERTMDKLTFGVLSGDTARLFVGLLEVVIGLCLISGRWLRLGLALLAIAAVGIIAPLVLFTDELFSGKHHAPTLLGQYVIKDIVLLAAAVVITAKVIAEQIAEVTANHPE